MKGLDNYFVDPKTGCWLWLGCLSTSGYGRVYQNGRTENAHRAMYERNKGPVPIGLTLDHFRLNPGPREAPCARHCINPDHVEPATMRANVMRGVGVGALNARKTQCPQGHPFTPTNTRRTRDGGRRCRACHRAEYVPGTGRK